MKSGNSQNQDFKEFLALLVEEKVDFALVGGYAVAYHGYPRYTGDMDILLAREADNAAKVLRVLSRFGFGTLEISEKDLLEADNVIQLGYPPFRIDLITSLDGIENSEVLAGRISGEFFGMKIPIISLEHLKRNKRATGRSQDLSDLEKLP